MHKDARKLVPVMRGVGHEETEVVMVKMDHEKMRRDLFLAQLGSHLRYPFDTLREFFDSVQDLFKSEQKRISAWMERETAGLSQDERDRFYEWHGEDYGKLEDSFPNVLRNSLFIAIYTELEDVLKFICRVLGNKKGLAIPVHKWRGGILEKVESCLKKDIGISWSLSSGLWDEILKIRRIRNALVHDGGWLDGAKSPKGEETKDTELLKYIRDERKSITLLERDGFYRVQLTDLFIPEAAGLFEQLLNELFESISHWVRKE